MAAGAEATTPGAATGALAAWFRRHAFEIALVAPLVVYVLVFTVAPIFDTFRISFTARFAETFPSAANYRALADDPVFRDAVVNTVIVALLSIALELVVGMATALALHKRFFGRGFARTVLLIPLGVPTIVSGAVMLLIFSRSGYLNAVMFHVADLVSVIPGIDWSYQPTNLTVAGGWRTLFTVAVADMWKVLPIVTLIFLAGLQSIPEEIYEAADIDGATVWQKFTRVTLPLLVPYITMALILRAIDAFRIFELALVLAGRVESILHVYIWNRYSPPTNDPFTAAAGAAVLFAIIMVFIVLYLKFVGTRAAQR
ncbi:MAG: sugar ABC transporter permease [Actinomycetota bacterium]|nr:sugar ABC transporter permease [Actinomycetota bacterium]